MPAVTACLVQLLRPSPVGRRVIRHVLQTDLFLIKKRTSVVEEVSADRSRRCRMKGFGNTANETLCLRTGPRP